MITANTTSVKGEELGSFSFDDAMAMIEADSLELV